MFRATRRMFQEESKERMKKRPLVRTRKARERESEKTAGEEGTGDTKVEEEVYVEMREENDEKSKEPQNFFRDFYFTMDVTVCECACVE